MMFFVTYDCVTMTCDSVIWHVTDVWQFVTVTYNVTLNSNPKSKIENKMKNKIK